MTVLSNYPIESIKTLLKLKEDIHADIKEQESIILFVYDDIKVFEKSRTYKVELKELTKEKK